jgi:hypothetical protein
MELIKAMSVAVEGGTRLRIGFTNGDAGVHDFAGMLAQDGPMIEPLKDPAMFERVFVQSGALCWPSGYDIDALALHASIKASGELAERAPAAA